MGEIVGECLKGWEIGEEFGRVFIVSVTVGSGLDQILNGMRHDCREVNEK